MIARCLFDRVNGVLLHWHDTPTFAVNCFGPVPTYGAAIHSPTIILHYIICRVHGVS